MGLFGGGNSSSSTTNNETLINRQLALDNASNGITGDGNVFSVTTNTTATDHEAVAQAMGVSSGAVSGANQSLMAALSLANSTANNALAANTSTVRDALAATTSATRDAITAVSGANSASLNFASTVNRDALDLAARGQSMIASSAAESLGMVGHVVDLAFQSNDASAKRASDAGLSAADMIGRAYNTATAYQAEKQTADSKYLVIAGLVAVAMIAMKAFA
ncbi:MAG TPA: hypothetical protein VJ698_15750 [Noviherbaspirillum sp.]|uniref:hypothetical protein n=1 Tax=Noviherbaspirillum sp. TaxID=1926288 RepID=UPI002B47AD0D|nr:hypothetical protein [Noviherbaspirillum sp.]HJV86920.1 hypothetical protein [Noviherbaspirillum sp.]